MELTMAPTKAEPKELQWVILMEAERGAPKDLLKDLQKENLMVARRGAPKDLLKEIKRGALTDFVKAVETETPREILKETPREIQMAYYSANRSAIY